MTWEKVRLVDVCDFQGGTQPPKAEWSSQFKDGYIRMIQIRDYTQAKDNFIEYVKDSKTLKKCNEDDIMVGRYGASIGKILTGLAGAYNVALVKTIPSNQLNREYFYHYLNTTYFQNFIQNAGSRAAQAGFNKEELKELQIPLPPLPIQKRIAEILDTADALRRKDEALLKKYDELAQAIFIDMFGDPVKNEKGWEVKKLGEVIDFPSGLVNPMDIDYRDLYHVGGDNIDSSNGRIFGLKQAKELGLKSGKFYFTSNHILYNKIRPYLNKVALPDFNGICSADMYPLLPKLNEVMKEYLYFILRSKFFLDFAERQSRRANIPKINMTEMSLFELPVPPIDIQSKFISKLNELEKNIQNVGVCKDLTSTLFDSLLLKAFNGELVA